VKEASRGKKEKRRKRDRRGDRRTDRQRRWGDGPRRDGVNETREGELPADPCVVCIENYLRNYRDDGPPNTRRTKTARGTRDETEKGTTRRESR